MTSMRDEAISPARTQRESDSSDSARSVADKLFAILDAVQQHELGSATLSTIARRAQIPMSTAHRLVAEWVKWGGLVRDAHGGYSIGKRLWEVGVTSPNIQSLRAAAMPFLEDLLYATKQHAQLALLDGTDALYVERLSSRQSSAIVSRPGRRLPLHATGVGLVLLAHAEQSFIENYLAKDLTRFTRKTITEAPELRKRLELIRRQGFARTDEELHEGALSIAAPVRDRVGTVIAAMSIVIPPSDRDRLDLEPLVQWGARGTSRLLGYRKH